MREYLVLEEIESVTKERGLVKCVYDTRKPLVTSTDLDVAIEIFESYLKEGKKVILITESKYNKARLISNDYYYSGVEILRDYYDNIDELISSNFVEEYLVDGVPVKMDVEDVYRYNYSYSLISKDGKGGNKISNIIPPAKRKMVKGIFYIHSKR